MSDSLTGQISRTPLSRAQCRAIDRDATARFHVPSELLMENAGAAVARSTAALARSVGAASAVLVCGTGNNGGDGFVAARQLWGSMEVRVFLAGAKPQIRGDALANLRRLEALGIPVVELDSVVGLRDAADSGGVWVDALFGTGLDRPIEGIARHAIDAMNASGSPVLAVDLPSGLDADTGSILGVAVCATRTVTFVAPKIGFGLGEGPRLVGVVEIVGIGVPVARAAQS